MNSNSQSSQKPTSETDYLDETHQLKKVDSAQVTIDSSIFHLFQELDLQNCKKKLGRNSTSGRIPTKSLGCIAQADSTLHWGKYYFVGTSSSLAYDATAIVSFHKLPWLFSTQDEQLTQFSAYSENIRISDKIFVGMPLKLLIDNFGKPEIQNKELMLFVDESNAALLIKIKNGMVSSFTIGRYNYHSVVELQNCMSSNN